MREALRAVAETARCAERPLRVAIRTRSSLVLRDLDLLRLSARRHLVEVEIPIATPDRRLARVLEPGAAAPSARIAVARRLRAAGVTVRVLLDPLLPGVTDLDADLRTLLRAVRDAGASIGFPPVRVPGGAARRRLLVELRRVYPRVAARYEVRGYVDARPPAEQADAALRRAVALARETGLTAGDEEPPIRAPPADAPSQRLLAFPA
jgi:DNA repair photolyase